jgi:cell division protein FtsN
MTYREPASPRYAFWRSSRKPVLQAAAPPVAAPAVAAVPANAVVAQVAPRPPAGQLQLQVGAFADEANARRAMLRLAAEGPGIEPLPASGSTLYRVVLRAPADPQAAEALRLRVARSGFPDARFVRLP